MDESMWQVLFWRSAHHLEKHSTCLPNMETNPTVTHCINSRIDTSSRVFCNNEAKPGAIDFHCLDRVHKYDLRSETAADEECGSAQMFTLFSHHVMMNYPGSTCSAVNILECFNLTFSRNGQVSEVEGPCRIFCGISLISLSDKHLTSCKHSPTTLIPRWKSKVHWFANSDLMASRTIKVHQRKFHSSWTWSWL